MKKRLNRWLRTAAAITVFGLAVGVGATAAAQDESGEPTFEELIQSAKTEYDAENYDAAIDYLIAANRTQPNARLLLNIAKSYEKAGDCVRAQVYYRAFVRNPEAEQALVPAAEKEIKRSDDCEGFDPLMAGRLMVSSAPSGAMVLVDGEEVGTAPLEVAGIMEGQHTVTFELEGYKRLEKMVDMLPDRDKTLEVELEEAPQEVAEPEPEPGPEEPVEPEGTGTSPVVHYAIAGGIGAAGLGLLTVGLLTDLGIPEKYDEPREQPGISQEEFDRLTEERSAAASRALIFYIAGGALVAGGAGYAAVVAATSGEKESSPTLTFSPTLGPEGLGFAISGEF